MRPHHPKNVPGEFYTTGECLACGAPEAEAPTLLAALSDDQLETYFVRQPENPQEVEAACRAAHVCCVSSLRYSGQSPYIIRRLGNSSEFSDYVLDTSGRIVLSSQASLRSRVLAALRRALFAKASRPDRSGP